MLASKHCKAILFTLGIAIAQVGTVYAQSLGVVNSSDIRRNIQSLDQVYALAPSVIAGQYPMSATRAGIVPAVQAARTDATIVAASADAQRDFQEPVVQPVSDANWAWIGTTAVASLIASVTYLIMRPQ